jgi:AcrR family transcriptional regulator
MGPKNRRQREREELREKILDAARELFVTQGVEAVTMRKIAEKIEYSATALYGHFADKESLLRALCDADFRSLRGSFGRIARIADPVERLRELGRAYVGFALEYPSHYRLLFMTRQERPLDPERSEIERGNPDQDAYAFLLATVAEGLAAGRFRDEFDDADLVAQVVWSGVHGVVALELTKGDDRWLDWRPVAERSAVLLEVVLRGILKEDAAGGLAAGSGSGGA